MGTNYYYETVGTDPCPTCGRGGDGERLHIGKSSAGWAFSLHIIPERSLNTLEDWQKLWTRPGTQIRDEYGEFVTIAEMLAWITQRSHPMGLRRHSGQPHEPQGFVRPGEPTYDLVEGEFS